MQDYMLIKEISGAQRLAGMYKEYVGETVTCCG